MANGFSTVCAVGVSNAYNTTGTLTRGSYKRLTPTQIEALFTDGTQWHEMRDLLRHTVEMQACGIPRDTLYEWVISSNKPGVSSMLNIERVMKGSSRVRPFILGKQRSVINSDYWYVSANQTKAAYDATTSPTLTGVDAGSRVLGVKSTFGTSGLELSGDYFLKGKMIYQLTSVSTALKTTHWKVVQAGVNSQDSTVLDVEVVQTQDTSGSILGSSTTSAAGIILAGPNNVHNVEAWCRNMVNTNDTKLVPFWMQTMRDARRIDTSYEETFEKLMADNEWFAKFQDIPLVERNRQDEVRSRKEFLNAFFYGEAISSNQTLANWASLSAITSASNTYGSGDGTWAGGETVGYRANMIGVVPQLHACGRVTDSAEANIDIATYLQESIYDVYRARKALGRPVDVIDIFMSSDLALNFQTEFFKYTKGLLGDVVRINAEDYQTGTSEYGFPYQKYKLYKPVGLSVSICTDPYFDDYATAATTASTPTIGKQALVLDVGASMYPAIIESKRVQWETAKIEDMARIDPTYACRMENPSVKTSLTSKTATAIVECPLSSRVDRNFAAFQYNAP